jgi:hypothetical protein
MYGDAGWRSRRKFAGELEIEFPSTKLDGTSTKKKIRRGETQPGAWDGERSDGEGDRSAELRWRVALRLSLLLRREGVGRGGDLEAGSGSSVYRAERG